MALKKFKAPALPVPPMDYEQQYMNQLVRVLGTYFNLLDSQTPIEVNSITLSGLTKYSDFPVDGLPNGTGFRLDSEDIVRIVVDGIIPAAAATQADLDILQAEINTKVAKTGDTMTGNLTVPSVTIGAFTIQEIAGKLTFSVAGNAVGSLDTSGNFTVIGNVTGFGTP
jgi:hypothetical protein